MKALTYAGPHEVAVDQVDDPVVRDARDAVVRVTSAAICGSDLHMFDGRTSMPAGTVLGHEIMGIVEETGNGVHSIRKGDRVVLPFNIACGYCFNCSRGFTNACLVTNPEQAGAAYGYVSMGPHRGGQAEYALVPFADFNCIKLPGEEGDEHEDDFLMLADIFPTGYYATELAKMESGKSVAIYGAGPVGLLAAHSARLRGASDIFIVDQSETRLAQSEAFGATPIDFTSGLPSVQIKEYLADTELPEERLPEERGENKLEGVMCGIDAVGYQARSFENPEEEDPTAVLNDLTEVVNPTGAIGIIGVYMPEDPGAKGEERRHGIYPLPIGKLWSKGISLSGGQTPVKRISLMLRDLIVADEAHPGDIVSHHITIDEAPEAYRLFDERGMGDGAEYTKIVIRM